MRRRDYLREMKVVEIQQTFYQPPQVSTARHWRTEAPLEFEFTLKAWQLITHEASSPTYRRLKWALSPQERVQAGSFKDSALVRQAWDLTRETAESLSARVILFQCPASFSPRAENLGNLRHFFSHLARDAFIFAWEPRGNWPREVVAALCQELNLLPALDPFVTPPFPGPQAYFRLHGKGGYRYAYTGDDLKALGAMVARHEAYVLFNNMSMWQDACRFARMVGG